MKKWNNPELLNLMVQETKEVESHDGEKITNHKCSITGEKHKHNGWTGMCSEGHGKVQFNGFLKEDYCCVSAS